MRYLITTMKPWNVNAFTHHAPENPGWPNTWIGRIWPLVLEALAHGSVVQWGFRRCWL